MKREKQKGCKIFVFFFSCCFPHFCVLQKAILKYIYNKILFTCFTHVLHFYSLKMKIYIFLNYKTVQNLQKKKEERKKKLTMYFFFFHRANKKKRSFDMKFFFSFFNIYTYITALLCLVSCIFKINDNG